jgi:hypothetical protein
MSRETPNQEAPEDAASSPMKQLHAIFQFPGDLMVNLPGEVWVDIYAGLHQALDIAHIYADDERYGVYGAHMQAQADRLTTAIHYLDFALPQIADAYHQQQTALAANDDPIERAR